MYGIKDMSRNPLFQRTISGNTDLVVNDLKVTGDADLNNVQIDDVTFEDGNVGELEIANLSGNTFTVSSVTPATSILTAASVFRGGVGIVSNLIVGDTIKVNSITTSISKTTGALIVSGGAGFNGRVSANSVFVNNTGITSNGDDLLLNAVFSTVALRPNFSVNGQLINTPLLMQVNDLTTVPIMTVDKTTLVTTVKKFAVSDITPSTSTSTGCAVFEGGVGVKGVLSAGGFNVGNTSFTTTANEVIISANSDSIYLRPNGAAVNGELINGVSVTSIKNSVGTIVFSLDKTTDITSVTSLAVTSTTVSVSTITGCATFAGGIGVNGKVSALSLGVRNVSMTSNGDDLYINGNNAGIFIRPQPGGNGEFYVNTIGIALKDDAGANIFLVTKSTQVTRVYKYSQATITTASTSSTTGANNMVGGLGISCATNAVSATNGGGATIAGGLAVAQDAYVGGKLTTTGILSGATLTLTANTGSFTPTIISDTTVTYTEQLGQYYLVGNLVFIQLAITTTGVLSIAANVDLQVGGLPFTVVNNGFDQLLACTLERYALPASTDWVNALLQRNTTTSYFRVPRDDLQITNVKTPTTSATRYIRITGCYRRA